MDLLCWAVITNTGRCWSALNQLPGPSELFLGREDRKLLHEFEERCVEAYFHERRNSTSSNQTSRIRATAERSDKSPERPQPGSTAEFRSYSTLTLHHGPGTGPWSSPGQV